MKKQILSFLKEKSNKGYSYTQIYELKRDEIKTRCRTPRSCYSGTLTHLFQEGKIKRCKVGNFYRYYVEKLD